MAKIISTTNIAGISSEISETAHLCEALFRTVERSGDEAALTLINVIEFRLRKISADLDASRSVA